jgi:hypothetical protein
VAKAEITIWGTPYKTPRINSDGSIDILFRINRKDSKIYTYYKISINNALWKTVSKKVQESSYYIIKGETSVAMNTKGMAFIDVQGTDIKVINSIKEEGNVLTGELPEGTDEVLDIDKINVPARLTKPITALNKAMVYFEKHGTFKSPIIVKREDYTLVQNYASYLAARQLNIQLVPVAYDVRALNPSKDESGIRGIQWYTPEEIIMLDTASIVLTEDIHLNTQNVYFGINLKDVSKKGEICGAIAVRPIDNGKYSLVIGAARYFAAKILDIPKMPAVITDMNREEFINNRLALHKKEHGEKDKATGGKMQGETLLSLINVPEAFLRTKPNPKKIEDTIEYYKKHGQFDKPIIIGKNNLLIDGYKRYVAAKELGLTKVWTLKRR